MNTERPSRVSVLDPLNPSITGVKTVLFQPFDLKKWFIIGFCAWLAYFGSGTGGPNFGGPNFGGGPKYEVDSAKEIEMELERAKDFIVNNLPWIGSIAVMVGALIILLWLVITWLSSRGRFMFLHCVANNKAEVKIPWKKFQRHSNSLFLFRIVLTIVGGLVVIFFLVVTVLLVLALKFADHAYILPVIGLIMNIVAFICVIFGFSLVAKFTSDFVVPIMFLGTTSCVTAWRQFLALLSANKARFLLYILFQIVIAMVIGVIVIAAVCVTCCCAACILAIPYIGTVLMLPLLIFKRAYSLYYLQQFGPRFDVFAGEIQAA
jgi:hypothetical protein